ncbi:hypothetical protein V8F20_006377 [Naviculisporaceae sp. PSN 640]
MRPLSATSSLSFLAILLVSGLSGTVYAAPTLPATIPGEFKRSPSPLLGEIAGGVLDVAVNVPGPSSQDTAAAAAGVAAADFAAEAAKKAGDNAKSVIKRQEEN